MSHISWRERGEDVELEVDVVVVGSGAGGAAAASWLARNGIRVAVVEAGAWRDPEDYPSSVFGAMRDLFDDFGGTVTMGGAFWPVVQARTMGGTTVINSAIAVRTPGDVLDHWHRNLALGDAGTADDLWRWQDGFDDELHVSEVPVPSRGRHNELAMLADERLGFQGHVIRRYAKDCEGSGQCLQGCRGGRKQSTNLQWIPEVRTRGGVVVSCAPVDRVVWKGDRAVGVTGRFVHPTTRQAGARFTVRARTAVIVAASATHSPALLERSRVRSKVLGTGFKAHPGTGVFGVYDEQVDMSHGATQGWASTHFRESPGLKLETLSLPLEMMVGRLGGAGPELMRNALEYRHIAMWVQATRAESSVGSVHNGWGGKPVVRYTLSQPDLVKFRTGLHLVARMHVAAGAKAVLPGIYGLPYRLNPDQIDLILEAPLEIKRYFGVLSHLFGGCVMGSDPSRGVVDSWGRVYGTRGLIVADASVIPTTLGVNPQHTIMALARRFAQHLLESPKA